MAEPFTLSGEPRPPKPKPKAAAPTYNLTNDMVDWARWTWNPFTGCEHTCKYRYARDIANRFYPEKCERDGPLAGFLVACGGLKPVNGQL
jgi:DNA repair photolyase